MLNQYTYQEIYAEVFHTEDLEAEGYYHITVKSRTPVAWIPDTGHK